MFDFGFEGEGIEGFGPQEETVDASVPTSTSAADAEEVAETESTVSTAFSGFGGFGGFEGFDESFGDEDSFLSPKEAKAKAVAEKKAAVEAKKAEEKAKKAEAKAKAKKPAGDVPVKLPVTIKARGFAYELAGEGEMKLSEIRSKLLELGYDQFHISTMGLYYLERTACVYVTDSSVVSSDKETLVDLSEEKNVTVCDGQLKATFTLADFEGKEADEVSLADLTAAWVAVNPSYKGCSLAYNEASATAYPVLKTVEEKNYSPAKYTGIVVEGNAQQLEDELPYKELFDSFKGVLSDMATDNVVMRLVESEEGYLFVSYTSYKAYSPGGGVVTKTTSKKVEEKYPLPLTLYVVTWGDSYPLTPEMFGGKEKVTLSEIKKVMAEKEPIFADEKRSLDTYYRPEDNRLSVGFKSGSKGAAGSQRELRSLPIGDFYTYEENGAKLVAFERKLPKIPEVILREVISFFKEDLSKEAACRLLYRKATGTYEVQKAIGVFTKVRADYEYPTDYELMSGEKLQVMEFHSHNTMRAFFSTTDDVDEVGRPGVFGVIGRLDRSAPEILLRAGIGGRFCKVFLRELFDVK